MSTEFDEREVFDNFLGLTINTWTHPNMGSLCGYVHIPKTHPLYGESYDTINDANIVTVHGNLTYSDKCHVHDDCWVLGFDCSHFGDYVPLIPEIEGHHWTHEEVLDECRKLARQLVTFADKYKLLPCPFCGGKAVGFEWSDDCERDEGDSHYPDAYCGVKVHHKKNCILKVGEFEKWYASTEEEATMLWNTRSSFMDL